MQQRPRGITILAIAILISAGVRFAISFFDMAIGSYLSAMAASPGYMPMQLKPVADAIGDLGFWIGLFGMIVALVMLFAVRGLWTLRRWGWWLTLVVLLVALFLNVVPMVQGTINARLIVQSLFDVVFLVYLVTPGVRAAFRGAQSDVSAAA
jgi:hypothetical protein